MMLWNEFCNLNKLLLLFNDANKLIKMRRILNQTTKHISIQKINDLLYKNSFSKNADFIIALQLYYINKAANKKQARLPRHDFRRPVLIKAKKQIPLFRRLTNQINFDFANVFVHKIMYRYFL